MRKRIVLPESIKSVDTLALEKFSRKWNVEELSLFGSVVRDDFGPESDVDVLVRLPEISGLSLYDWMDMVEELKVIFGREVDLVEMSGLKNPYRRKAILDSRRVIYTN